MLKIDIKSNLYIGMLEKKILIIGLEYWIWLEVIFND